MQTFKLLVTGIIILRDINSSYDFIAYQTKHNAILSCDINTYDIKTALVNDWIDNSETFQYYKRDEIKIKHKQLVELLDVKVIPYTPPKVKYRLNLLQRLLLPVFWLYWKLSISDNKKTWHEYLKGMESHEHKYTIPETIEGHKFLKCEHLGCNMYDPV